MQSMAIALVCAVLYVVLYVAPKTKQKSPWNHGLLRINWRRGSYANRIPFDTNDTQKNIFKCVAESRFNRDFFCLDVDRIRPGLDAGTRDPYANRRIA